MSEEAFKCLKSNKAKNQIICFPYLGGYSHSFRGLANSLDDEFDFWAANPPGHMGVSSNLIEDIIPLIEYYFNGLKNIIREDYVLFGHSMGGIVAYYLAQRIIKSKRFIHKPKAIILSASAAPDKFYFEKNSELPDEELIDLIISFGGMPKELLNDSDFMHYLLPIFRADYRVLESIASRFRGRLSIPAYLLLGEKDDVDSLGSILSWRKYFIDRIKLYYVKNGTHMFIHDKTQIVAEYLKKINKIHIFGDVKV